MEKETNDAIALFGDREAGSIVLLKNYESYYYGYDEDGVVEHYYCTNEECSCSLDLYVPKQVKEDLSFVYNGLVK